jgi:phosphatidylserine/phosphatidylglycerophosphate/cardiolipin synthase-like enzyme
MYSNSNPMPAVRTTSAAGSEPAVPEPAMTFLTTAERGNPYTRIDARRGDDRAFTAGNDVTALVHGADYFHDLTDRVRATGPGDLVLFTDWRGDADERMDGYQVTIAGLLSDAAGRGVIVKGLMWRSHWRKLHYSAEQNRRLGDLVTAAGGECLRDMRVRVGGSHHQKLFVVRYRDRPQDDIAYVGGIDLCHSRGDDAEHRGDPQAQRMAEPYGRTPPWHDIQLAIQGPAVGDVEACFRERWTDPTPLTRHPLRVLSNVLRGEDTVADPIPAQTDDPPAAGELDVQVLRTYPYLRRGFPFAPRGERSVARAYAKAVGAARELIYIEDQYFWSTEVVDIFARRLRENPNLYVIAVVPMYPDQNGLAGAAQTYGRARALAHLRAAAPDRIGVYTVENEQGVPIYVHAKACVIDDDWTCVGSDNFNLRSWTHDSELSCAVRGGDFGRAMRMRLHHEHLARGGADERDLIGAKDLFKTYAHAAARLDAWYDNGKVGPRPAGRLRRYDEPHVRRVHRLLARPIYHLIADPDGRPRALRRAHEF